MRYNIEKGYIIPKIQIVGVGALGSRVINFLSRNKLINAELVILDSDITSINYNQADKKILIGPKTCLKLGFGSNRPDDIQRTEKAIFESKIEINNCLKDSGKIFIISDKYSAAGLVAVPMISQIATNNGVSVFKLDIDSSNKALMNSLWNIT